MIQFLAFSFKLIFSCVILIIYGYLLKKEKDAIILITLIGLFSTAITAVVTQLSGDSSAFAMAGAIFGALYISNSLVKDEQMYDKITIIFSSVIGIIVGIGSILQSLILMILLYGISQSSLLNLIEDKDEDVNNGDLVDNLEEFVEEN